MKTTFALFCLAAGVLALAGCASPPAPIPTALTAAGNPNGGRALLAQCIRAHGGRAAYERLHDVNVRYDGQWAALGPRLQPKLSDTGFRGGSEERYLIGGAGGFAVGQNHHGPKGEKWVFRPSGGAVKVAYVKAGNEASGPLETSTDPEVLASAELVADAYTSFLFGPFFFEQRGACVQKLDASAMVNGRACDEVLAILRPGLGKSPEDRAVLYIDRAAHLLRRVQFTLDGLEGTRGAEVHVDLMEHRRMDGVLWPTQFYEHIERPVNLPAHRWHMSGFDSRRGHGQAELEVAWEIGTVFRFGNRVENPARALGR